MKSLDSWSDLTTPHPLPPTPFMDQTGFIKYPILCFCLISILFLLLEIYNVFRGIGKPYVKSLDSWSDLPDRCVQSIVS